MNKFNHLLYCRQFLLTNKEITGLPHFHLHAVKDLRLYRHPALTYTQKQKGNTSLVLLGSLFDHTPDYLSNGDILERLIGYDSFEEVLAASYRYAGRFALIHRQGDDIRIFHDCASKRKVYYYFGRKYFCVGSAPRVIARYFQLKTTRDEDKKAFYGHQPMLGPARVNLLDTTRYDSIKSLLPNHYLDLKSRTPVRFFPSEKLKRVSLQEGIHRVSEVLKGYMENFNHRHRVMMAVTAGNDSRLLMAASRSIHEQVYYYIHRFPGMDEDHQDLRIPGKIFAHVGGRFHVLTYPREVDPDFREIYFRNSEFACEANLPAVYHTFYRKHRDKLNIPTTLSDVTRNFFTAYRKWVTPRLLARMLGYKELPFVVENYRRWLEQLVAFTDQYSYSVLDLFNWEERYGNWGTYWQRDKDLAQEEMGPFNSRLLLTLMLGVPSRYRDVHTNAFHRMLIRHMWPDLLRQPFNPNWKKQMSYTLKRMHLYWPVRKLVRGW